jgi:hypothetical protein
MKTVITILAIGLVVWWFVKPTSNGIAFVAGLWGNVIQFFQFLTQGK